VVYVEQVRNDYLFATRFAIIAFNTVTWQYQAGASLQGDVIPQGCIGLEGIAEYCQTREPPYYVGSFLLQVIDRPPAEEKTECGTYEIDFASSPQKTFVRDPALVPFNPLTVIPATVDLADFCVERGADCLAEEGIPPFCKRWWCDPCTGLCELLPDVGHPCQHADPCIVLESCSENSECVGRPKVCLPGEFCNNVGECEQGACPLPESIVGVTPAHCEIDARQPHAPDNDANVMGWDEWVIKFTDDCAPRSLLLAPADFTMTLNPFGSAVPPIERIVTNDFAHEVKLQLADPIDPGKWTCLQLIDPDDPLNVSGPWCLGYLPGDVDGGGTSQASDIDVLIAAVNGDLALPDYSVDINRSIQRNAQDILRLIDLLNGAMLFDPGWMGESLPRCGLPMP
jgi:hypothetical protein